MTDKTHKMIRIKWVRSGIGFTYHQKTIVRSLGLRRLNQTVVRPDTPQIRGIVAAVPHLLAVVPEVPAPAWASVPEYIVYPPAPTPAAEASVQALASSGVTEAPATEAAAESTEAHASEPEGPAGAATGRRERAPAKAEIAKVKLAEAAKAKSKATKKDAAPKKAKPKAKARKQ